MNIMRHALFLVLTAGLASIALAQQHDKQDGSSHQNSSHSSGGNSWNRSNGGSNQRGGGRFGSNQSYSRGSSQNYQRNNGFVNQRVFGDYRGYGNQQPNNWQYQGQRYSGGSNRVDTQTQTNYQRQRYTGGWNRVDTQVHAYGDNNRQQDFRSGDGWRSRGNYYNDHTANQDYRNNLERNGRLLHQQDYGRNWTRGTSGGDWRNGHHNLNGSSGNPWLNGGTIRVYGADRFHHYDNWRCGYYYYTPYWNDSSFYFSFYSFTPYEPCVVSPWYAYPMLPPYIAYQHVYVMPGVSCPWYGGTPYNYNGGYGSDSYGGNPDLNYSINEIVQAFNTGNDSDLGRIIPSDSRVNIYNEGTYMYSVNGGDFYNMLMDNVHGTKTQRYVVTGVRMEGDDAIVTARHDFYNPYNGVSSAYQMFRLRPSGEGYVITDFMTSTAPLGGSSSGFSSGDW